MKILDLCNPALSDIPYQISSFPDGQPHIEISTVAMDDDTEIVCRANTPENMMLVSMASTECMIAGSRVGVNVSYLMGGRMDRRIGKGIPVTLQHSMQAALGHPALQSGLDDVFRFLDPHSAATVQAATDLDVMDGVSVFVYPTVLWSTVAGAEDVQCIVCPDKGARERASMASGFFARGIPQVMCTKKRDTTNGALSNFSLGDDARWVRGRTCLIVDDIIDGGGTFVGVAKLLREAGAKRIVLCVTHAIFSKGFEIEGIDAIYTTDSFRAFTGKDEAMKTANVHMIRDYMHREVRSIRGMNPLP